MCVCVGACVCVDKDLTNEPLTLCVRTSLNVPFFGSVYDSGQDLISF